MKIFNMPRHWDITSTAGSIKSHHKARHCTCSLLHGFLETHEKQSQRRSQRLPSPLQRQILLMPLMSCHKSATCVCLSSVCVWHAYYACMWIACVWSSVCVCNMCMYASYTWYVCDMYVTNVCCICAAWRQYAVIMFTRGGLILYHLCVVSPGGVSHACVALWRTWVVPCDAKWCNLTWCDWMRDNIEI